MVRETGVHSMIDSYKILNKRYLMPPCLKHRIIKYGLRVNWTLQGKELAPSIHLVVIAIEKADCMYIYIYIWKVFFVVGQREKKANVSKWICPRRDLYILKNYIFRSHIRLCFWLLLSSENICSSRSYEWGAQWDSNSLV